MPKQLTGLRVFVASPGNLRDERNSFLQTIQTFNADDAPDSGVSFIPQGHEFAFAGVGRPQELINEQIRSSDYMIVIFWDKWGSQTSDAGTYTSGTEEEFEVALECLQDPASPMRDVVVLFKGVDDRQLSDPGEQLKKVLAFKSRLEDERLALYDTFDTTAEFQEKLRRQFQRWIRSWSTGETPAKASYASRGGDTASNSSPSTDNDDFNNVDSDLERAIQNAKRGRNTEAEQLFARLITGRYNGSAFSEYARFLRKLGRYSASERVSTRQLDAARDAGDHETEIDALANLGLLKRLVGHKPASEMHFRNALKVIDAHDEENGPTVEMKRARSFVLDNLAHTLRKSPGRIEEALDLLKDSVSIRKDIGDAHDRAHTMRTMGVMASQLGLADYAEEVLRESLQVFEEEGYARGQALVLSSLGEVLEQTGQLDSAETSFESALALNTAEGNRQGRSMNMTQLSRVLLAKGKATEALEYAEACVEMNERGGNPEGLAAGLHALGRVMLAMSRLDEAGEPLSQALEAFTALNQPFGMAAVSIDIGHLSLATGDQGAALEHALRAKAILESTPHKSLREGLEFLMAKLPAQEAI